MQRFDGRKRNAVGAIGPQARGGRFVVEGVVRFVVHEADEGQRCLVVGMANIAQRHARRRHMIGDHRAEHVVGQAADEAGESAETRHGDGDVEARAADRRHIGVPAVG
ncbi:MAG: hypothetical protein H6R00_4235, partial [Proteobacteria bacterium]|nr:hypothetical protein [Pseudomonadota bacterium]